MLVLFESFSYIGKDLSYKLHNVLGLLSRLIYLALEGVFTLREKLVKLQVIRLELSYSVTLGHRGL